MEKCVNYHGNLEYLIMLTVVKIGLCYLFIVMVCHCACHSIALLLLLALLGKQNIIILLALIKHSLKCNLYQ